MTINNLHAVLWLFVLKRGALCLNFVCVCVWVCYFVFACISNASINTMGNQLDEHYSFCSGCLPYCVVGLLPILLWLLCFWQIKCDDDDVSDYVQMDVFTSTKSAKYVEILGQGRKQTSRIHRVIRPIGLSVGRNAWR